MKAIESIIDTAYPILCAALLVIGAGLIALAFFVSPVPVQAAAGLGGLGFIALALLQVKRERDGRRDGEKLDRVLADLEEIREKLKEEPEKPKTVIADILTSGLKYYTDYRHRQKEEEEEK